MNQHELDTLIQSGEGYKTEFKRNVNTDLSKELTAFWINCTGTAKDRGYDLTETGKAKLAKYV